MLQAQSFYTTDKSRKAFVDTHPAADARSGKQGMAFYCKICRCITLPDGHFIHGTLAIVRRDNGERRSQARTVISLLYHFNPSFMNTEQEILQHTENAQSTGIKRERRDSTISFRVSNTQWEHIGRLADKCGMTLSDYVLARSYSYRPKARLTSRQETVRDELIMARSDYARYTSMLNAMPQDERRAMFRNQSWMVGALQLLGRTAEAITRIIDRHFAPNRIPKSPQIQKQNEPTEEEL